MNAQREVIEAAAKLAGLTLGAAVGEWYWRADVPGLVRRNANGTDTLWNPIEAQALQRELQIMLASAQQHSDGEVITGYTIKTGALHRIVGMMAGAGFPVSIPAHGVKGGPDAQR